MVQQSRPAGFSTLQKSEPVDEYSYDRPPDFPTSHYQADYGRPSENEAVYECPSSAITQAPRAAPLHPIHQALREICGIDLGKYALVYMGRDGQVNSECSTHLAPALREVFGDLVAEFEAYASRHGGSRSGQNSRKRRTRDGSQSQGPLRKTPTERNSSNANRNRKRRNGAPQLVDTTSMQITDSDIESVDEPGPAQPLPMGVIRLDNEAGMVDFYRMRFKQIQQIPCKAVAKEWIKVIEPKKQTKYPYNGGKEAKAAQEELARTNPLLKWDPDKAGDYCKPPWWPQNITHKEPDHIRKDERIPLLIHLLRNLNTIEGYKDIRVTKLKESTNKAVQALRDSRNGPEHAEMEQWLNDIYRVRGIEEDRLEGGMDDDAVVTYVAPPVQEPRRLPKKSQRIRGLQKSPPCSEEEATPQYEHDDASSLGITSPIGRIDIADKSPPQSSLDPASPEAQHRRVASMPDAHPLDQPDAQNLSRAQTSLQSRGAPMSVSSPMSPEYAHSHTSWSSTNGADSASASASASYSTPQDLCGLSHPRLTSMQPPSRSQSYQELQQYHQMQPVLHPNAQAFQPDHDGQLAIIQESPQAKLSGGAAWPHPTGQYSNLQQTDTIYDNFDSSVVMTSHPQSMLDPLSAGDNLGAMMQTGEQDTRLANGVPDGLSMREMQDFPQFQQDETFAMQGPASAAVLNHPTPHGLPISQSRSIRQSF